MERDDTYFPEYDSTPYGGGFDLEDAYGKSHAPSEKSCYAPSLPPADADADADLSSLRDDDDKLSAYGVEIPHFDSENSTSPSPEEKEKEKEKGTAMEIDQPQSAPESDGRWTPIYPELNRDSDLLFPSCTCGMPNYCTCASNIFHFYHEDEKEEDEEQFQSNQHEADVANKVAQWLFSSTCI